MFKCGVYSFKKRLLHSSKLYKEILDEAINHGIQIKQPTFNLDKMMDGKENTVNKLTRELIIYLKNNIKYIIGQASIDSDQIVKVKK